MKVLIADDSLLICARLMTMLAEFNQIEIVGHAQKANEAISLISKLNPDVVILDIQMGDGNGIEVLKRTKQEHPSLIAIMLSNHSTPHYQAKCLEAGANFFFDKSTEFFALQDLFADLLYTSQRVPLFDWSDQRLLRYSE